MKMRSILIAASLVGSFSLAAPKVAAYPEPSGEVVIRAEAEFHEPLAEHGSWIEVEGYGRCWHPARVEKTTTREGAQKMVVNEGPQFDAVQTATDRRIRSMTIPEATEKTPLPRALRGRSHKDGQKPAAESEKPLMKPQRDAPQLEPAVPPTDTHIPPRGATKPSREQPGVGRSDGSSNRKE
jgi:hypothetical protein